MPVIERRDHRHISRASAVRRVTVCMVVQQLAWPSEPCCGHTGEVLRKFMTCPRTELRTADGGQSMLT
jgi:hypothetical protein